MMYRSMYFRSFSRGNAIRTIRVTSAENSPSSVCGKYIPMTIDYGNKKEAKSDWKEDKMNKCQLNQRIGNFIPSPWNTNGR